MHEAMERLYVAAKQLRGLSGQSAVAAAMDETPQTLNNWESRGISNRGILKAQKLIGCSSEWLTEGIGPMRDGLSIRHRTILKHGISSVLESGPIEPSADFVPIARVLFKFSAGITGYEVEPLEGNGPPIFFRRDWIEKNRYRADKLLAVRVTGASMETGLYDGDLIVINTLDVEPKDGEAFAVNYEREQVIKRLKRNAGQWWLTSDNLDKTRYGDKLCDENSSLIGRVIYKQSERI